MLDRQSPPLCHLGDKAPLSDNFLTEALSRVSVYSNMQLRRRVEREAKLGDQDPSTPWRSFDDEPPVAQ